MLNPELRNQIALALIGTPTIPVTCDCGNVIYEGERYERVCPGEYRCESCCEVLDAKAEALYGEDYE